MTKEELEITEIVNRETEAWNKQDVNLLITVFHPDMVWPWPPTSKSHDPIYWEMVMSKFDRKRWSKSWQGLFDKNKNLNHWKGRVCKVYSKIRNEWKMTMHMGVLEC